MQKNLTESQRKYFVNMDEYLGSVGLYRKSVAQDASSLFRAVSEKLYFSQNYHQKIRQDCADFMRANMCNFETFVEGSFEKYLERLEDPKETVGQVEIKALSQLYRHSFLIYRYPGEPAIAISEGNFVDKVTLCASNNHYDIIYPRSYIDSAALCQSLLYELLYTKVFGIEEVELCEAVEAFAARRRHYKNRSSVCVDLDYDTPEERCHREKSKSGGAAEEKLREVIDDTKLPKEAPPPSRLSLPYKVIKSLDGNRYRNLEFDVWLDTCKETQKINYMVFEGRQYFLGDKCQVCLGPKGKYYNAFIQEVGTHSSAVTVFIEELAEKHLVPLTDLIPVKPVPAWNVADPTKKGDLVSDSHGQQSHRRRYSRKSCCSSGVKGTELLMPPQPYHGGPAPSTLGSHFQPHLPPFLSPGALTYTSPYYHHPQARHPCNGASSCTRWQLPTALNREYQSGFPAETMEEPTDLDAIISYYQLDDASDTVIPPLPGPGVAPPLTMGAPPPLAGNTPVCSSEEDQDQSHQTSGVYTAAEPSTNQVVKPLAVICSSSSSSSSPSSEFYEPRCTVDAPPPYSYSPNGSDLPQDCRVLQYYFNLGVQWSHLQQQQGYPATLPEASYPYQHHTFYMEPPLPAAPLSYPETTQGSHQPPSSDPEITRAGDGQTDGHSATQSPYPETIQGSHQPPSSVPESTRAGYGKTDGHSSGSIPSIEGSSTITPNPPGSTPSSAFPFPHQMPLPLLHVPYEAPPLPLAAYLPSAPPPLPRSAHPHPAPFFHRSSYHTCLPPSIHWGALQTRGHVMRVHCPAPNPAAHWEALQTRGHATRVYCPTPNPAHMFGYVRAPPPYQRATHYIPPTI